MDEQLTKRRWNEIFYQYRYDYIHKHRLERKAKKIKEQLNESTDVEAKKKLRKELKTLLAESKKYSEHLSKKYKLKMLPDPLITAVNFQSELFFPTIEVISQEGDYLTVTIDRSYPKSALQKELADLLRKLDLVEGKKPKKSGRPKLIDPKLVAECSRNWRDFYTKWQKYSRGMSDKYSQTYISNTTLSALVMDRLKETFPNIEISTLNEYAKPYLMK
jgi:hypothetical protein